MVVEFLGGRGDAASARLVGFGEVTDLDHRDGSAHLSASSACDPLLESMSASRRTVFPPIAFAVRLSISADTVFEVSRMSPGLLAKTGLHPHKDDQPTGGTRMMRADVV